MAYAVAGAYLVRLRSQDTDAAWTGPSGRPRRSAHGPGIGDALRGVVRGLREAFTPSADQAHRGPEPEPTGR